MLAYAQSNCKYLIFEMYWKPHVTPWSELLVGIDILSHFNQVLGSDVDCKCIGVGSVFIFLNLEIQFRTTTQSKLTDAVRFLDMPGKNVQKALK